MNRLKIEWKNHVARLRKEKSNDDIFVCGYCGCPYIAENIWVDMNTAEFGDNVDDEKRCDNCNGGFAQTVEQWNTDHPDNKY